MDYVGEHPLPGIIGRILIIVAFAAALFSAASYFFATREKDASQAATLRKWGRIGFILHAVAVLAVVGTLFYMFANHLVEYQYIHSHTNKDMPVKYIMVAFWGGQQGSLLLWAFWHVVLGLFLLRTAKKWESPAMCVFALVQVFVTSTLLGAHLFGYKIGENPFALYREADIPMAAIWSQIPDYLQFDDFFHDGTGLNLTLQNYWMVIHPPTLFLGFASVLVPFVYAIAGLWTKDYKGWLKPAIPWTFFSIGILGAGILMGGAWAYESLNFGGFWAWDPVENASLVPWLVLVGAGHIMLIARNKRKISYMAFLFPALSFILILYSTFLTRSGVLGNSSVHSFTGDGMLNQLLIFMVVFIWLPFHMLIVNRRLQIAFGAYTLLLIIIGSVVDYNHIIFSAGSLNIGWRGILFILAFIGCYAFLYISQDKHFPKNPEKKPDPIWSREFWMFTGALLFLLSSVHIIVSTSMPVLNDILGTNFAPVADKDRNEYYADYQVPFAIAIGLLMTAGLYMRYRGSTLKQFVGDMIVPMLMATAITVFAAIEYNFGFADLPLTTLLFVSCAVVTANLWYWIKHYRYRITEIGAPLAHVGFGVMVLGIVISQARQDIISKSTNGTDVRVLGDDYDVRKEAHLYRNDTTLIGNYFILFNDKFGKDNKIYWQLEFFEAQPRNYSVGDTVRHHTGLGYVAEPHQASSEFGNDYKAGKWVPLFAQKRSFFEYPQWQSKSPGKKLFELHPHVQLTPTGESGSNEPGTKHYWNRDVFVYLRGAELELDDDLHHSSYAFKKTFSMRDTVHVPYYFVIPDSIYPVTNKEDYMLMTQDSVVAIRFRVHPVISTGKDFVPMVMTAFEHSEALYILRDTMHLPDMQEVPNFGLKLGLNSLNIPTTIDSTGLKTVHWEQATFDLVAQDREYIVLKAIEFPMINLLWIGALLMTFGSFLSVLFRIRKKK